MSLTVITVVRKLIIKAKGVRGEGVPNGGTTGQVLYKDSNLDQDTSWQTPAGGGGGPATWGAVIGTLSNQIDLQAALDLKANQTSISNINNTSDANKPISTATQTALDLKVDKVGGKQLSTEDYSSAEKTKLSGIATAATANSSDATLLARANHTGTQLAATISDFLSALLASVLTGLSLATSTAVTAADSILVAVGKLQAQITALTASKADITIIDTFSTSGTWTKRTGVKSIDVYVLGGGGGGGSGRRAASGGIRCGGGGGAIGGLSLRSFAASTMGATETVTVGAGGVGGAGRTADANGIPGGAGGNTTFGIWLKGLGGSGGEGGTATTGTGGAALITTVTPFNFVQRGGASASATGGNGASGVSNDCFPTPGGAGGGVTSGDSPSLAGAGGIMAANVADVLSLAGGIAGGVAPAAAGNGNNAVWIYGMQIGTGGGGGRGSIASDSGAGGNGGKGAGGGGAGAVQGPGNGGAGGNGGDGWCVVVNHF